MRLIHRCDFLLAISQLRQHFGSIPANGSGDTIAELLGIDGTKVDGAIDKDRFGSVGIFVIVDIVIGYGLRVIGYILEMA